MQFKNLIFKTNEEDMQQQSISHQLILTPMI